MYGILTSGAEPRNSLVARARQIGYRWRLLGMSNQYTSYVKARSSVVERFPDTEEVGGSIPPVPTISVPSMSPEYRITLARFVAGEGTASAPGVRVLVSDSIISPVHRTCA